MFNINNKPNSISKESSVKFFANPKCKITIDKRLELLSIITTLTNYWDDLSKKFYGNPLHSFDYKKEIYSRFRTFEEHDAVKAFRSFCNDVEDFSKIIQLAFYLSRSSFSKLRNAFKQDFSLFSNHDKFNSFLSYLNKFSIDINFNDFFKQKTMKIPIKKHFLKKREIESLIYCFEKYTSTANNIYNFVLSPLVLGNYGIALDTVPLRKEIYLVFSPSRIKNGYYFFGSKLFLSDLILHELCHTFINELINMLIKNNYKQEIIKIKINPKRKEYNDNIIYLIEYIIRAITIRIINQIFGTEASNALLKDNKNEGFDKIENILELLKEYENIKMVNKNLKFEEFISENFKQLFEIILMR